MLVTTIEAVFNPQLWQELWREVMKDEVPGSKAYLKAEYYMGQAIALYGAETLIKEHNEREKIFDKPFELLGK